MFEHNNRKQMDINYTLSMLKEIRLNVKYESLKKEIKNFEENFKSKWKCT